MIEPPLETKTDYAPGDGFAIGLTLIGAVFCAVRISRRWAAGFELRRLDLQHAKGVQTADHNLTWRTWERYSNRKNRRMQVSGFTGDCGVEGDLERFHPLLALGMPVAMWASGPALAWDNTRCCEANPRIPIKSADPRRIPNHRRSLRLQTKSPIDNIGLFALSMFSIFRSTTRRVGQRISV